MLPEWLNTLVNTYLIAFVLNVLFALVLLFVGFAVIKWVCRLMHSSKHFERLDSNVRSFLTNFIELILKLLVIITAVIIVGVPESTVIAALGSCGLAIGLALQGGLSNIASGVILMFCRPFHVGDFIISGDISGVVKDIGIYYTMITTADNQDIHVPNATLAGSTITNLSTESTRRLDFDFTVSGDADIALTRKVLLATAQMNDLVLKEPSPEVLVTAHGAEGLTVKLRVWCAAESYWTVNFDMWEDVKIAFDKFGIGIPHQHVDVVVSGDAPQE